MPPPFAYWKSSDSSAPKPSPVHDRFINLNCSSLRQKPPHSVVGDKSPYRLLTWVLIANAWSVTIGEQREARARFFPSCCSLAYSAAHLYIRAFRPLHCYAPSRWLERFNGLRSRCAVARSSRIRQTSEASRK